MKTKLEMAHEYFLGIISNPTVTLRAEDLHSIQYNAWQYADAMQAEADKRNHNGDTNEMTDDWQPDWSQAPDTATHWTIRPDGKCLWWKGKPLFDGSCFYDAVGICHTVGYAPSFGYTGDWRESLRKRPK